MKTGVVADDVTGANDIGIMYAKEGFDTYVYNYLNFDEKAMPRKPDILILDTDSRLEDKCEAYNRVYGATKKLEHMGCNQYYNKTCSVFRGNIGSEFDAMLDALNEEKGIIVLGFPKNGRITKDCIHYVHGKKLENSEFKNDPVNPMCESDLQKILQNQTKRKVGTICGLEIDDNRECLNSLIQDKKKKYDYIIFDVRDQNDLKIIAQNVINEKIICGSSALAEELAKIKRQKKQGIVCIAGSLMPQTKKQVEYLIDHGAEEIWIDTTKIFDKTKKDEIIKNAVETTGNKINKGIDIVIHSLPCKKSLEETYEIGIKKGFSKNEISKKVSMTLAEIAYRINKRYDLKRLIIAGGDTSARITEKLGIKGMKVYKEIEPGLPSCITLNKKQMLLVLKSGSFGCDDFLKKATEHLKETDFI